MKGEMFDSYLNTSKNYFLCSTKNLGQNHVFRIKEWVLFLSLPNSEIRKRSKRAGAEKTGVETQEELSRQQALHEKRAGS